MHVGEKSVGSPLIHRVLSRYTDILDQFRDFKSYLSHLRGFESPFGQFAGDTAQGPKVMRARRPGSTKRLNIDMAFEPLSAVGPSDASEPCQGTASRAKRALSREEHLSSLNPSAGRGHRYRGLRCPPHLSFRLPHL